MKFVTLLKGSRPDLTLQITAAMTLWAAVVPSSANAVVAARAANGKFYGFTTQAVASGAPSYQELLIPQECPKTAALNDHVTVEHWAEFEAEGADYLLLAGTGQIAAGTPVDTPLTYYVNSGVAVLRVAQTGELATHRIKAQLNPEESGGVRIWVTEVIPFVIV